MYDVITIGAATRDVFIRSRAIETHAASHSPTGVDACLPLGAKVPIDEIHFTTGGGATNAAVTFARLGGLRAACVCRIGTTDAGGHAVLADLRSDRVATTFVQRDPTLHTGYSLILLSGSGERTILVYRGASDDLRARTVPWTRLRARWFYVTSLAGDLALARRVLSHAERIGARVAWNPGGGEIARGWQAIAPLARRCAVFNVNREEATALTRKPFNDLEGILTLLRPTPPSRREVGKEKTSFSPFRREGEREGVGRVILITDGSRGACAVTSEEAWHIAARDINAVNTTGAGDAFGSAFVLGLHRAANSKLQAPSSIDDALRLAMANAECVITHMGAKAGILAKVPIRAALTKYNVQKLR